MTAARSNLGMSSRVDPTRHRPWGPQPVQLGRFASWRTDSTGGLERPGQVIGYVRVSATDQNPDQQTAAISDVGGGPPDRWFTDHASGASTTRPALTAMLAHVRDEDTIVVTSMDRLARPVVDVAQLVTRLTGDGVTLRFPKEGLTFQAAAQADPTTDASGPRARSPSRR